ncbi:hypothetical protein [Bradyrhizobium yuanmingense]|uniref:hypothetical protein n=1 Tax=Bradyrhizobium yuanmingense TaxID=108015 RepID=UPI0023B9F977|nr:hypothetical protein [Bradyrhizobium yuanmingense]MDF0584969.1 hypothetical protein [Bradyrhizobium yuanmingense]
MEPFDGDLVHFVGDRVIPVSSQAVDAGPDQEMSSGLLRCAEKLVNVTLAISDMDASSRMIQELRRLLEIFQPPDAFLFLDGKPDRIDLLLSAAVPLNFFRVQNLTAANPSGTPSIVTARLECIRMPQTVCDLRRPALSRPLFMLLVMPTTSDFSR